MVGIQAFPIGEGLFSGATLVSGRVANLTHLFKDGLKSKPIDVDDLKIWIWGVISVCFCSINLVPKKTNGMTHLSNLFGWSVGRYFEYVKVETPIAGS